MIGKEQALDHPLPKVQNPGKRELWNAKYPWNWVLLSSVLGCLLFWALVVWGTLSVF